MDCGAGHVLTEWLACLECNEGVERVSAKRQGRGHKCREPILPVQPLKNVHGPITDNFHV